MSRTFKANGITYRPGWDWTPGYRAHVVAQDAALGRADNAPRKPDPATEPPLVWYERQKRVAQQRELARRQAREARQDELFGGGFDTPEQEGLL